MSLIKSLKSDRSVNKSKIALMVGLYDICIGLWPLLSMRSFARATGFFRPLVVMPIAAAWATLGFALLISTRKKSLIAPLGTASTLAGSALAAAECLFVSKRVISPVFLIQALAESYIGLTWIRSLIRAK